MTLRRLLRNLGFSVVTTVVSLVLLEGAATGWELYKNGTVRLLGRPVGVFRPGAPTPGHDAPSLQPGAHLAGELHDVHLNRLGFRGPEVAPQKPAGGVRIWCAGGSTTFDIGVSDDAHTWPAQVQARLQELVPSVPVEVIDAGVPGEVVQGNLADFRRLAPSLRPDVVVLYEGPNDLGEATARRFGAPPPPNPVLTQLSLYRVLSDVLPAPSTPAAWATRRVEATDLAPFVGRMREFVQAARQLGATPVLTSHALRAAAGTTGWSARWRVGKEANAKQLTPEAYIAAIGLVNEQLQALAAEDGLLFVDVRAAVGADPAAFDDGIHFVDAGAAAAGDRIARALVDAGLVRAR